VFLVLWNGAVLHNQRTRGLFSSAARLQSYVERVLAPLAAALRAEPALGGWEVINEPEGLLAVSVDDPDGCFNATPLRHSGAGWALPADPLSMRSILGFIGAQAAAIHRAAPGSLVTVGAWSERTVSGALGLHDFYTAKCLRRASGGQPEAYLDFLQVHSYASRSKGFSATSPFKHAKADYALKAPLVIGEFCPGEKAEGMTAEQLYQWAFDKQYDGGWGWTATSKPSLFSGMAELKNEPKVGPVPASLLERQSEPFSFRPPRWKQLSCASSDCRTTPRRSATALTKLLWEGRHARRMPVRTGAEKLGWMASAAAAAARAHLPVC